MRVLLVILLGRAIWRTTRLLVVDEFPLIKLPRDRFIDALWDDQIALVGKRPEGVSRWIWFWRYVGHSLAYLWTCPWCMSVYVGAGLVAAADWRLDVPYPWLIVAAGSLAAGLGATLEQAAEQRYKLRERELDDDRRR